MIQSAEAGQKSSTSHQPASKPVSLAPLNFEEAVTALSRVVPQHQERKELPPANRRVHKGKTRHKP
jgi:hypothetical protein